MNHAHHRADKPVSEPGQLHTYFHSPVRERAGVRMSVALDAAKEWKAKSQDVTWQVRRSVASNASAPPQVLSKLRNDNNKYVSQRAAQNLKRLR